MSALAVAVFLALAATVALAGRRGLHSRRGKEALARSNLPPSRTGNGPPGPYRSPGTADGLQDTAMTLELMAAMLDSGAGLGHALDLVARCAAPPLSRALRPVVAALAIGTDWETAWRGSGELPADVLRLKQALSFAALTGAPSAAILYAQAARERRERFRAAEKKAAALGVKLVVPLGLCSLPAFICLGVVPVLIAMLPGG